MSFKNKERNKEIDYQNVLGALSFGGSEKNYKPLYINHLMDTIRSLYTQLPGENSVTRIIALRDEALSYVDDEAARREMLARCDEHVNMLREQLKQENGGVYDSSQLVEAHRIAAIRCIGWVLKYFDTAWGWSRRRGILIAGPFGDGRRRFLPLSTLPEDGKYLRVPDNYEPRPGEDVVELRLRQLLFNNLDDPYDEARSEAPTSNTDEAPQE